MPSKVSLVDKRLSDENQIRSDQALAAAWVPWLATVKSNATVPPNVALAGKLVTLWTRRSGPVTTIARPWPSAVALLPSCTYSYTWLRWSARTKKYNVPPMSEGIVTVPTALYDAPSASAPLCQDSPSRTSSPLPKTLSRLR